MQTVYTKEYHEESGTTTAKIAEQYEKFRASLLMLLGTHANDAAFPETASRGATPKTPAIQGTRTRTHLMRT